MEITWVAMIRGPIAYQLKLFSVSACLVNKITLHPSPHLRNNNILRLYVVRRRVPEVDINV